VLRQDCVERGNNPSGVGFAAPVSTGDEDHPEVTRAAGRYRLVVRWAEVPQVVCDDGPVLGTGQRQHLGI
jgi:hypothetical protein